MRALVFVLLPALLLSLLPDVHAQGCSNTCPPINFGAEVPSLCEGDSASDFANIQKVYPICHPTPATGSSAASFSLEQLRGRIVVLSNFYVGCNAGRRESGVYAHVAQRYFDAYGESRITFLTSLKGGSTCAQWAGLYQQDAIALYPNSTVVPKEMPLTVLDQDYELRDDFFTTPFGHPSYVILDQDLKVRHKFIGPCCGYESFFDCTADIAMSLDETLSNYLDGLLEEMGGVVTGEPEIPDGTQDSVGANITVDQAPCQVGNFSDWSPCSVECGPTPGIQFRWRIVEVTNSTATCPAPVETRSCEADVMCEEQCIPEFGETYEIQAVATGFDSPRDVAFHPTPGLHLGSFSEGRVFHPDRGYEAWIVNGNNHSISIVTSLGDEEVQSTMSRRDRGYYHYMINATALAFNTVSDSNRSADRDTFNYFSVCNDNRNTYLDTKEPNNFMGPTLYNTDPRNLNLVNRLGEICGEDEECFFLHADMLHESPECIGIAHDPETITAYGTVYWVFDATGNQENGQLVRFDFQQPHGPGSMDHSVASVRRFPGVVLDRGPLGVHAGMLVHPETRELFIAVPGANKIIAVRADSGTYARTAREEYPIFSNRLPSFEYSIWECPEQRVVASDIRMPSGIALKNETLFVAERETGDILVLHSSTGVLQSRIETGLSSIGGMSFSPDGILHFVDEATNALYKVQPTSDCLESFLESPSSPAFEDFFSEAMQAVDSLFSALPLSLYRDYNCIADPIIANASFFDQVHEDTGYASDNPDVQSEMAGMDETAELLANRTDCEPTSELNFDALLLGGYFCHQCLPGNDGAVCGAGGSCTNVQWLGYICDNEFIVSRENVMSRDDDSSKLMLTTADRVAFGTGELVLKEGVTYRFTVRGAGLRVCVQYTAEPEEGESLRNDALCASQGPLIVAVTADTPNPIYLRSSDGKALRIATNTELGAQEEQEKGNVSSAASKTSLIVGIVVPVIVLLLVVVAAIWFFVFHQRHGLEESKSTDLQQEGAIEAGTKGGSDDNSSH